MADAADLKSAEGFLLYGFESRLRHHLFPKDATRYVYLKLPTVIFGATGFGTHAKHERVSLQSLVEYTEMFTKYLTNLKCR